MLKEKLEKALEIKKNDFHNYVWKGPKKYSENGQLPQEEVRLIDCSEEQLKKYYEHCISMLTNKDIDEPGRYVLLDIIRDQKLRCNAELFMRYLEKGGPDRKPYPRYIYLNDINEVLNNNRDKLTLKMRKTAQISLITGGVPAEFENLPIDIVIEACLDKLGKFDKRHLTLTFILSQGVWFTSDEIKELTENGNSVKDIISTVKERLEIKQSLPLKSNPKGLTYSALRSMVLLRNKKYSDLTTEQLITLRNRILFTLEEKVNIHISQWETRMQQIEEVANHKGYSL